MGYTGTKHRFPRRPWTPDEVQRVVDLLSAGYGMDYITATVQRSYNAIVCYLRLVQPGGVTAIRSDLLAVRSRIAVARLFGVAENRVDTWIQAGWLKARRNRRTQGHRRTKYLITDEAILTFLECRDAWVMWEADDITDPDWREHAREIRAAAGGRWVRTSEIPTYADRFRHYSRSGAGSWVDRGLLPSIKIQNVLYVWSADLDRFIPPSLRPTANAPLEPAR
ncbi:MAG TPA: hypothetical protein VFZ66_29675 [Herpetosiphonaceae bacterium]